MTEQEIIKYHYYRNEQLKQFRRQYWEPIWQASGQFVMSQLGSMLSSQERIQGEKRGLQVFDGTPEHAKDIMVAGFYSGLVPDNAKWYRWIPEPMQLMQYPEVRQWLGDVESTTYLALSGSAYGDVTLTAFEHQVGFGTSVKFYEPDDNRAINCQIIDLTSCVFCENAYRQVDTCYREFQLSVRNALKYFDPDKLPEIIRSADRSGNRDDLFNFLHVVTPRSDFNPTKADNANMPFESLYLYASDMHNPVLRRGGYRTFPYTVTRMYRQGNELYGRGPAIKALQDMGVLNEVAGTLLIAGQRVVSPALAVPADGFNGEIDLSPNAINPYVATDNAKIYPIQSGINLPYGIEMADRQQTAVQRWFHVDVFLSITQADNRMTATEALERKQEKLQLLGPLVGRQKRDHLDIDLDRIFDILLEEGYFPKPPQVLRDWVEKIRTEYTGPLFQAQMRRDSDAVLSAVQKCSTVAIALNDPSILDNIDADAAYAIIADRENVPPEFTKRVELRDQERQARAQQAQAMQQAQASMAAVEAAKNLGSIPVDPATPNALTELVK